MSFRLIPVWCYNCSTFITESLQSESPYLCRNCYGNLPFIISPICQKCGLLHNTSECHQKWADSISAFHAIFNFCDPVHQWVNSLKYSQSFFAGKVLQDFVQRWFEKNRDKVQKLNHLVPVPVHPLRLRRRGFNQARYLLNRQKMLPIDRSILVKKRHTPQQAGLSAEERNNHLYGSFEVKKSLKGQGVLVFDDVCTTGQTLGEISRCLKGAGAERVEVLVLCRNY